MRRFLALLMLLTMALPAHAEVEPELVLQNGHREPVLSVAVTADGTIAVSGAEDDTAKVWDLRTGRVRATLDGHRRADGYSSPVRAVAIDPAGRFAVTGGADARALVWDLATARVRTPLPVGEDSAVFAMALSPDAKRVAVGSSDRKVRVFDLASGKATAETATEGTPNGLAFSPDGKWLALGQESVEATTILDAQSLKTLKTLAAKDDVLSVAFSPNGAFLAAGGDSGLLQVFDTGTWAERGAWQMDSPFGLRGIGFHGDIGLFVVAEDGQIRVHLLKGQAVDSREVHPGGANAVAVLPDLGVVTAGQDDTLRVWTADLEPTRVLEGHSRPVVSLGYSRDGRLLLSGGFEGTARVWDTEAGRLRKAVGSLEVASNAADLSPDGSTLALAGFDGKLRIYGADGSLKHELEGQAPRGPMGSYSLEAVAFSPDGTLVATAGPQRVDVWDVALGRKRARLEQPSPASLAWSPDGRQIATGGWDGNVRVWDLATRAVVDTRKVPGDSSYARRATSVATDGKLLAAGTYDARVVVWELGFDEEPKVIHAEAGPARPVFDLVFSADSKTLLAGTDRSPVLMDVASGKATVLATLPDTVTAVRFSPDGSKVLVGSRDGAVRVLDRKGTLLATAMELDGGSEWVVTTPDGLFDGSSGGQRLIEWRIGDKLYGIEQFFVDHYSPGLLGRVLQGGKTEKPQAVAQVVRQAPPPRVEIVSPAPGAEIADAKTTVTVKVTDQGGGSSGARLFHNGHRLPDSPSLTWTVDLVEGANRFRASAFNAAGTVESRPDEIAVASTAAAARKPELYVLAVGVDSYRDGSMNLKFAADDAKAVAGIFEPGLFAKVHPTTLTDAGATKAAILKALGDIGAQATAQDAFVLFLAGHGTLVGDVFYYLPHDANLQSDETVKDTGISAVQLSERIADIPAVKQVVVLDACHSGASARLMTRSVELPKAQQALARNSGSFLIAASSPEQKAGEVEALGHGVLTYTILEAVKPGSGVTTVNGLLRTVSDEVPRVAERYLKLQQQVTQYSNGQDFPLLVR